MKVYGERPENIVTSCLGLVTFIMYSFLVYLVLTSRNLRSKRSNRLLVNLGIGHALTGVIQFIGVLTLNPIGKLAYSGYVYSSLSLIMLSIDRCIFIRWPFIYERMPEVVHVIFMGISPLASITSLVHNLTSGRGLATKVSSNSVSMMIFVFGKTSCIFILLALNLLVYLTVRKHKQQIKVLHRSKPVVERRTSVHKDIRAFYICFGCVITFALTWLPCISIQFFRLFLGFRISYSTFILSFTVANLNPFSDAFIFVWFDTEVKTHLKKILSCCFWKKITCGLRKVRPVSFGHTTPVN